MNVVYVLVKLSKLLCCFVFCVNNDLIFYFLDSNLSDIAVSETNEAGIALGKRNEAKIAVGATNDARIARKEARISLSETTEVKIALGETKETKISLSNEETNSIMPSQFNVFFILGMGILFAYCVFPRSTQKLSDNYEILLGEQEEI